MKKISAILTICVLLFGMVSCSDEKSRNQATTSSVASVSVENSTEIIENITTAPSTNSQESSSSDVGGGDILQDKYRVRYYGITAQFARLVDKDELTVWKEEVYRISPNDTNVMIMKRFVQDFNISREEFDKANKEWACMISEEWEEVPVMNPKDYLNQEIYEVYNADIIYTFDDDIINEYYLSSQYPFCYHYEYENAVLSGTYKTQTTDFYFDYDDHSTVKLRGYKPVIEGTDFFEETILHEKKE